MPSDVLNDTYNGYVKANGKPTPTDYDWLLTSNMPSPDAKLSTSSVNATSRQLVFYRSLNRSVLFYRLVFKELCPTVVRLLHRIIYTARFWNRYVLHHLLHRSDWLAVGGRGGGRGGRLDRQVNRQARQAGTGELMCWRAFGRLGGWMCKLAGRPIGVRTRSGGFVYLAVFETLHTYGHQFLTDGYAVFHLVLRYFRLYVYIYIYIYIYYSIVLLLLIITGPYSMDRKSMASLVVELHRKWMIRWIGWPWTSTW